MSANICIRRETKNRWERRSPFDPATVGRLRRLGIEIDVESSSKRIFDESSFLRAGAQSTQDSTTYKIVVGIKEPEISTVQRGQVHLAFSHTIKGQSYNMPLLQCFIDQGATLVDYETMTDQNDKRVIAFGRFAGIAGAADTLWLLGQKLDMMGQTSGLASLNQTITYGSIEELRSAIEVLRPLGGTPLRFIIVGMGNSGRGAAEVMDWLGIRKIDASDVTKNLPGPWYAMLRTTDVMERLDGKPYEMDSYKTHGSKQYRSCFDRYLGHFDALIQTAFWNNDYPKHLDSERLQQFADKLPLVIGDISCDVDGSLSCTQRITTIDHPAMTYDLKSGEVEDGISLKGPTILAVDNLPCELPWDASKHFSAQLESLMPDVAKIPHIQELDELDPVVRGAIIVFRGQLTPSFKYLHAYL